MPAPTRSCCTAPADPSPMSRILMSAWRCSTARTFRPCSPTTASKTFLRCPMPLCTSGIRRTDVLIPVEAIDSTMARYCEAGVPVTSDVVSAPDHLSAAVIGLPGAAGVPRRPLRRHRSHHELLTPISDPPPQRAERIMSIATRSSPSTITACALNAGHRAEVRSTGRPVVDRPCSIRRPPIRHPHQRRTPKARASSTQSSTTTAVFEDRPASGERLRNRRSDCPIAARPRRWRIGSQPPSIAMGTDAHRGGTAARESVERPRRAAITMTSPYLTCNGHGITPMENGNRRTTNASTNFGPRHCTTSRPAAVCLSLAEKSSSFWHARGHHLTSRPILLRRSGHVLSPGRPDHRRLAVAA